jgi:hypothetical protein
LEVQFEGERLGCDGGKIWNGKRKGSGLARYCNDGGNRNNVMFTKKDSCKRTWGIKVLPEKSIDKGDEIFVDYGKLYWMTMDSEV